MLYLFSSRQRKQLKSPFGPVFRRMPDKFRKSRIISIGDIATLGLMKEGLMPFLAVFDFRTRRKRLDKARRKKLEKAFSSFYLVPNPPGFLSTSVVKIAKEAMKEGGAVLIDGEEDLTLLAFMNFARKGDVFIYGIPDSGFCLVTGEKCKKLAKSFIRDSKKVKPARCNRES